MYVGTWTKIRIIPTLEEIAVQYKGGEYRTTQMFGSTRVEHNDVKEKVHDWKEEINAEPKLDTYRHELIGMTNEFKSIRDGHLGCINVTNHRIEFTS